MRSGRAPRRPTRPGGHRRGGRCRAAARPPRGGRPSAGAREHAAPGAVARVRRRGVGLVARAAGSCGAACWRLRTARAGSSEAELGGAGGRRGRRGVVPSEPWSGAIGALYIGRMPDENLHVGRLLVCATPIGNLQDVTLRVLEALREVDVVACEDTRHTRRLLERHGIARGELVSFHEHNERRRAAELVARMQAGSTRGAGERRGDAAGLGSGLRAGPGEHRGGADGGGAAGAERGGERAGGLRLAGGAVALRRASCRAAARPARARRSSVCWRARGRRRSRSSRRGAWRARWG